MTIKFKADNLQKHKELSDAIKSNLALDGTSIKEKEGHGAYYGSLPEELDKKTVEAVANYNSRFITASHIAIGEMAAECFNKNKDATEVEAELGYFGKSDKINVSVSREKVYQNHMATGDQPKEITKHLVMKTSVSSTSAKGYGLKSIRDSMSEEFRDNFNK